MNSSGINNSSGAYQYTPASSRFYSSLLYNIMNYTVLIHNGMCILETTRDSLCVERVQYHHITHIQGCSQDYFIAEVKCQHCQYPVLLLYIWVVSRTIHECKFIKNRSDASSIFSNKMTSLGAKTTNFCSKLAEKSFFPSKLHM